MDVTADRVAEVVRKASGTTDAELAAWTIHAADHRVENMTTHALHHVRATLTDGSTWAIFIKSLHPASASPAWSMIPEEEHEEVLASLNWLDEPRVYQSGLAESLPWPLRFPALLDMEQVDDARISLWMEEIDDTTPWDLGRYERTALALGELAGRWPEERVSAELGLGRRNLDGLFFGKVTQFDLPRILGDRESDVPWIETAIAELRADMVRLAHVTPGLLARSRDLPHALAHGDATPDNFREPGDGSIVAIDWSYGSAAPVGSDLAQLLAGRFESGAAETNDLPSIAAVILDGYRRGLARAGMTVSTEEIESAWATHLAVRSVFSALSFDRPDLNPQDHFELTARRSALARFGLELALRVAG